MHNRITNASDINKPIIGTLDKENIHKVLPSPEEYNYQMTPKKKILRAVWIVLALAVVLWVLYSLIFVLN